MMLEIIGGILMVAGAFFALVGGIVTAGQYG